MEHRLLRKFHFFGLLESPSADEVLFVVMVKAASLTFKYLYVLFEVDLVNLQWITAVCTLVCFELRTKQ